MKKIENHDDLLFTSLHEYFWNEVESQTVCPQIKRKKKTTFGLCTSYCGYWIWGRWPFFWQMNCGGDPHSKSFCETNQTMATVQSYQLFHHKSSGHVIMTLVCFWNILKVLWVLHLLPILLWLDSDSPDFRPDGWVVMFTRTEVTLLCFF